MGSLEATGSLAAPSLCPLPIRGKTTLSSFAPSYGIAHARMTAFLTGLSDAKQIGRYALADGPEPRAVIAQRLRHGYKIVRMISDAYDAETAKAWLFRTNTRLDGTSLYHPAK
jgi:hypothetical protein